MINTLRFDIQLDAASPGWAEVSIAGGKKHVSILCGDCVDSIGNIVRGLAELYIKDGQFEVECDSEGLGGEWLLTFRRTGERFELAAKKFVSGLDEEHARHQRARLRHRGPWDAAIRVMVAAYDRLLDQHGSEDYEQKWGHCFPSDAWKGLKDAAREGKTR